MELNILDYIVIGGGIAGLYCNYVLTNKFKLNGLLLEKENYFGGRALEVNFHNKLIKLGAGIMSDKNKHLVKLLNDLDIKPYYFESGKYSFNLQPGDNFDMNLAIKQIIKKYNEEKNNLSKIKNHLTTEQFIKKYFSPTFAKNFITNCEFRDFLESDPGYFIKYYDINDMSFDVEKLGAISWTQLTNKLTLNNCKKSSQVNKITQNDNYYKIKTNNKIYLAKKIYLALTLKPLEKLLKNLIDFKYSDYIGTVEFSRIYTWHKKPYDQTKIQRYNLVPNELQKIIKIDDNILMSSYADNKEAKYWKNKFNLNKKVLIKKVETKLNELNIQINKIDDIEAKYWEEGVHYYKPYPTTTINKLIKKLSKPKKNLFVIGEIISKKHGWVEGCIQSVNDLLKLKI